MLICIHVIFELNDSLLTYSAMIDKFIGRTIVLPEDVVVEDPWNKVLMENAAIDSFATNKAMFLP